MCVCNKYVTVLQIYNDYYDVGCALFEKNEKKNTVENMKPAMRRYNGEKMMND